MVNIAVIGGGVIGVTSAIQIQKDIKNSKVTIFAEKLSPDTTGDLSAGFWTPYLLENTPERDVTRWSKVTHDKFLKLWKEGNADKAGICLLPVLILMRDENIEIPNWASVPFGFCRYSPQQVKKFCLQNDIKYTGAVHYVTFTCESSKLLPMLMDEFLNNGGSIIRQKIHKLDDLSHFDAIVNCAGLEARKLVNDKELHAIRGQISRVKAPWQFQIKFDESEDGCYIIPNTYSVILGGTHQVGDENLEVDLNDKEKILSRCSILSPGLKSCKEHLDAVGLRPGRNAIRISSEIIKIGARRQILINNYGHGGAGVTLCFGCAEDASKLLKKELMAKILFAHL